jgi:predicted ATPase
MGFEELLNNYLHYQDYKGNTDEGNTYFNSKRIKRHNQALRAILNANHMPTVLEEVILNNTLVEIKSMIDEIIPGEFERNQDEMFYIHNGNKLNITNLATGSKMFSIIKILLNKGKLDSSTVLILDEPEAHLHPSWQNKFAEVIVLLVKELGMNILLTTHSSNFVLAIDAYMRKHGILQKTNFYQAQALSDGTIEHKCVNDDISAIYANFVEYLTEVKVLRDKYLEIEEVK